MGARNVAAAYLTWAGKLAPLSMQVLVYMALVSRDADEKPWYSQGYAALAVHALGRQAADGAALKAVERAMGPLLAKGAVTVDRKAAARRDGASTARYRLALGTVDAPRIPGDVDDLQPAPAETERPPDSVRDDPRKPSGRPPETVRTTPEFRGTEEQEDLRRSENTRKEIQDLHTAVTVPRARCPTHPAMAGGLRPDQLPACPPCRATLRPRKEAA